MLETTDRKGPTVRVSQHAWQRYCQRVEPIEYDELQQAVSDEVYRIRYRHNKQLCLLAGVWWRYARRRRDGHMTLITCYGSQPYDMIDAMHWCKQYKDRLRIT